MKYKVYRFEIRMAQDEKKLEDLLNSLWEAEMHRMQGEVMLLKGDEGRAEACFRRSIEIARPRCWDDASMNAVRPVITLDRVCHAKNRLSRRPSTWKITHSANPRITRLAHASAGSAWHAGRGEHAGDGAGARRSSRKSARGTYGNAYLHSPERG